jgi:hypothetical protein
MAKKVAVITDTIAADQYFQVWHSYYAKFFGADNLYVVTYKGLSPLFAGIRLGGLWELPDEYNDGLRSRVISALVTALLGSHDYVVRADVDELVVPDPRTAPDLRTYIEALDRNKRPYVTARGFEVVEVTEDPPLEISRPLLVRQRRFSYRNSALNKTCLTAVPIEWTGGFHGGTVYPLMSDLYLFHLKYADLTGRLRWFHSLIEHAPNNVQGQKYWSDGIANILAMREALARRKLVSGWEQFVSREFDEDFLTTIRMNPSSRQYQGNFFTDGFLCEIPPEFSGML